MQISNDHGPVYVELNEWKKDERLKYLVKLSVRLQKHSAEDYFKNSYHAGASSLGEVSEEKLNELLSQEKDVHGISQDRGISNVIVFNTAKFNDSVKSEELKRLRRKIDRAVYGKLVDLFGSSREVAVLPSGHFWYPPGGYMSWHTNSGKPGWRLYINYAEEKGKSFFRYRDPGTGRIVTAPDDEWNFRIFRIDENVPFWHAVYSDTHRFSVGYMARLSPKTPLTLFKTMVRRFK